MKRIILDQNKTVSEKLAAKIDDKDKIKGAWDKLKAADKDKLLRIMAEKMGLWKE